MRDRASPVQLDAVEFWTGDLERMEQILRQFGFEPASRLESQSDRQRTSLACGNVHVIVSQGTSSESPVAQYVARHGDGIGEIALVCDDLAGIADRATAFGVKTTRDGDAVRLDLLGDGTIVYSVRHRRVGLAPNSQRSPDAVRFATIDHITYCLPFATLKPVARLYHEIFDLADVTAGDCAEVGDSVNGMRSKVLRSPHGFTVVLTEPASANGSGQTQQFLRQHAGAGVQHVAVACDDLPEVVRSLRRSGVEFLAVPDEHLDRSYRRLQDRPLPWDALRREQILVDADDDGLLLQLFTRPIVDGSGFFFELIHRAGATGFGAGNVRALFAAIDASVRGDRPTEPHMSRPAEDTGHAQQIWIDELVRNARARIPFYQRHLAGCDTSSLATLPTFDKSMTAGYGRFPFSEGPTGAHRVLATSGTTGQRLYTSFDSAEWSRTAGWLEKVGRTVGLTNHDVLLNTHCYGLWVGGPALDLLANRSGAGLVPLGPMGPGIVLELLADGVGSAISATPSYMRRLVEAADECGFDLRHTGLRLGFIGAEPAEESIRRKLLSRLPEGFRWIELYGLTETAGPAVAFAPDPDVPQLPVNTEEFWIEVLEPTRDRAVPAGDVGELTITTKRVDGRTPLIRYRTRDLVRAAAGPLDAPTHISRILGRVDHSLKIGGVLVYPSAVAEILSGLLPPTAEWRAVVRRRGQDDELLVEIEGSPEMCRAVESAFRERVGLGLTVTPMEAEAFSRSREKTPRILIDSVATAAANQRQTT